MTLILGASRKQAGLYYDKGGGVLNLLHPDFGITTGTGGDDTAALVDATAAAVALGDGARLIIPPPPGSTKYNFNTQIAPSKAIIIEGGVAGTDNSGSHSGPILNWTGGATPMFLLTGTGATNAQLKGLGLNNSGTATIAVQVESGGVALRDVSVVAPTVPFSDSAISVSPSGASTTPNVKLDNVVCRAAGLVNLKIGRIAGFLFVTRGSFMDPSAGGTMSVQIGNAAAGNEARYIHFLGTTFENTTTDLANVQISRARQVSFEECYFEIVGANGVAVDIPSSAAVAFAVHLQTCRLGAISGSPYALRSNFASAVLSADNCTLDGTVTGMFNNLSCRHALFTKNKYTGTSLVVASSLKNVTKYGNESAGSATVRDDGFFWEKEKSSTTAVSNVSTGETDLITYTLPAQRLYEDQQGCNYKAWGTTAANANLKQVRAYVAGTMVLDTTSLAANNKDWEINVSIVRNGATTCEVTATADYNGTRIVKRTAVTVASTGWDAAQILKVTGQSATASTDITQRGLTVEVSN